MSVLSSQFVSRGTRDFLANPERMLRILMTR